MGQLAGLLDVLRQVLLERARRAFLRAVVDVQELHLADGRADRRDVQAVFVLQVADLLDLGLGELHDVLDAVADVDEADAVVLQPQRGEGGELLLGRLLALVWMGGLVGKAGKNDARIVGHESKSVMRGSWRKDVPSLAAPEPVLWAARRFCDKGTRGGLAGGHLPTLPACVPCGRLAV